MKAAIGKKMRVFFIPRLINLTSDCQRSSRGVVAHWESDCSRVSFCDPSECETVCAALGFDHIHFVILEWDILKFPQGHGGFVMWDQTLEADVFPLEDNAALQEFLYADLHLCLTQYMLLFQVQDTIRQVQKVNKVWLSRIRKLRSCDCGC